MPPPNLEYSPALRVVVIQMTGTVGCSPVARSRNSLPAFRSFPCLLDHGFHVFEGLDIIGKSIDDKCRSICQTAATKGDEAVSFLLPRIVDGWDQVTPWSVRSDACPCPYMAEGKSGFEVLYMISLLEREVETSMYALEAWKVLATCSAHASEKGSP